MLTALGMADLPGVEKQQVVEAAPSTVVVVAAEAGIEERLMN